MERSEAYNNKSSAYKEDLCCMTIYHSAFNEGTELTLVYNNVL